MSARATTGTRRRNISTRSGWTYDLDPAHPGLGTPHCHVPAKEVYTIDDDGLKQPWFGLVFCNPPYGARRGHVPWLQKLIAHNNGVGLFRAYTSADWFHDVLLPARAVLMFPRGKIKFIRPSGEVGGSPGHGNVFIALGDVACEALLAIDPKVGVCWDRREDLPNVISAHDRLPKLSAARPN